MIQGTVNPHIKFTLTPKASFAMPLSQSSNRKQNTEETNHYYTSYCQHPSTVYTHKAKKAFHRIMNLLCRNAFIKLENHVHRVSGNTSFHYLSPNYTSIMQILAYFSA